MRSNWAPISSSISDESTYPTLKIIRHVTPPTMAMIDFVTRRSREIDLQTNTINTPQIRASRSGIPMENMKIFPTEAFRRGFPASHLSLVRRRISRFLPTLPVLVS